MQFYHFRATDLLIMFISTTIDFVVFFYFWVFFFVLFNWKFWWWWWYFCCWYLCLFQSDILFLSRARTFFFSSLKLRRLKLVGKVRNNIIRRGLLPSLVCSVFRLFIVFFSILFWNDVIVRIARFGLFSWIGWNKMN